MRCIADILGPVKEKVYPRRPGEGEVSQKEPVKEKVKVRTGRGETGAREVSRKKFTPGDRARRSLL
jgi:hypothetical protein